MDPHSDDGEFKDTDEVILVPEPEAGEKNRRVFVRFKNEDTASVTIIVMLANGTERREIDRISLNTTNNTLGKFPDDDVARYVLDSPEKSIRGKLDAGVATAQPTWVSVWDSELAGAG